jgi:hypothetical protein
VAVVGLLWRLGALKIRLYCRDKRLKSEFWLFPFEKFRVLRYILRLERQGLTPLTFIGGGDCELPNPRDRKNGLSPVDFFWDYAAISIAQQSCTQ